MARAALIDSDGIVENVIEVPDGGLPADWSPGKTVHVLSEGERAGPGWTFDGGEFLAPEPTPPPPPSPEEGEREAAKLAARLSVQDRVKADEFDDETVARLSPLFPALDLNGATVETGEVYRWDHTLVEVIQGHTTQPDWTPDTYAAGYKLHRSAAAGPQPWVQPTMTEDAYAIGEEVLHDYNGTGTKTYRSKIAANTTEPGSDTRWWEEVV